MNLAIRTASNPQLRELLVRHLRRPAIVNDELRYAEWAAEAQLGKEGTTAAEAFGPFFSPVAAKLLSDVCGFLVTVAGLNPDFRVFARTVFAQPDPVTDFARSAQGEQTGSESPISVEGERQPSKPVASWAVLAHAGELTPIRVCAGHDPLAVVGSVNRGLSLRWLNPTAATRSN